MDVGDWSIVVGVVSSAVLALTPWMFMVHAKLAVIAAQIAELNDKLQKAAETNHQLWSRVARHDTRLETHDVQLTHMAQRLDDRE